MKPFERLHKQGGQDGLCDSIALFVTTTLYISATCVPLDPAETLP